MKKRIVLGAVAALVAIVAFYFLQSSRTPSSQPPMDTLSAQNFPDFASAFNKDTTEVRLVLLISPT